MEIFRGIDYAFNPHPSIGAMKAAGIHWVGRYVSAFAENDINGKNLTRSEFMSLKAAGIPIILFAEENSGRMLSGHSAGVTDAVHFESVVRALGMNGAVMYSTADFDAKDTDQVAIHGYLDGVASILGPSRTGIYGGFWPVRRALNLNKAKWAVQTLAWSGGPRRDITQGPLPALPNVFWDGQTNWDTRAHVRQHLQIRVAGVSVDLDGAMFNDYGQWPRPAAPVPAPAVPGQVTADGTLSWRALAHAHGTPIVRSLELTLQHQGGSFEQPVQATYIRAGNWNALLPAGVQIWVG